MIREQKEMFYPPLFLAQCSYSMHCSVYIRTYNINENNNYQQGKWTEEEVYLNFLKKFDTPNDPDGKVGQILL